jgi:cobalt-zinc-cadmium efflux system membrane fusion protein
MLAAWPVLSFSATGKTSGCLIEPEQVADVGSSVTGVIEQFPVKLGDTVTAGQPLVLLRADVERANAQVAELRSSVDAEAKAAQANVVLARQKVQRNQQLLAQNFVSPQAVEQAVAEAEVAQQRYKMAQSQQQIYRREQAVANAQLGLRTLRSPINGVVVERYSNLGERVEERPVMRIASINPLRVSLMIPMAQYGQIGLGDVMTVRPELPGIAALQATVQYVDKVVDAASNTFRVRLLLPNPDHSLPGGLRCKADLLSKAPVTPAMTPAPAAAINTDPKPKAAALQPRLLPVTRPAPAPARGAIMAAQQASSPMTLRISKTLDLWPIRPDRPFKLAARTVPADESSRSRGAWLTASLTLSTNR